MVSLGTLSGWIKTRGTRRGKAGSKGAAMGMAARRRIALSQAVRAGFLRNGCESLEQRTLLSNSLQVTSTDFSFDVGQPVSIAGSLVDQSGQPVVSISSPTNNSTYATASNVIFLSGTTADLASSIVSMTWSNDRGHSGSIAAGANWSSSPIQVFAGANVLTITAVDGLGQIASDTLTVTYAPPAITDTWTGAVSNDWNDFHNWSAGRVPTNSDYAAIYGGTVNVTSGLGVAGLFVNAGTLNWTGGWLNGSVATFAAGSVLNISGGNEKKLYGGVLNNAGVINWSGGPLTVYGGAVINNLAGGVFDAQCDQNLVYFNNGTPTFNNAGTFRKSAGSGTTSVSGFVFNNTGTIDAASGTLFIPDLINNGTSTGSGALMICGVLSGAGTLGGQNILLASGFDVSGTFTVTGTLNWTGGALDGAVATFAAGSVLNISGSNEKKLYGGVLNNAGTINWSGGPLPVYSGAVINNLAGGVFDAQCDQSLYYYNNGAPTFNNAGTFRKPAGSGTTSVSGFVFNNTGTIDAASGTLFISDLTNNGTSTGSGALMISGALSGSGTLGGQNILMASGYDVSGTFTVTGTLNWTGGTLSPTNVTFAAGSVLNISGNGDKVINGGVLNNAGTINWSGGSLAVYSGAVINNLAGGVLDARCDQSVYYYNNGRPIFNNAGTLRKSAGSGNTYVSGFVFNNTGSIDAACGTLFFSSTYTQTAGSTILDGGNLSSNDGLTISGGTVAGYGTIAGSVTSSGTVAPSTGVRPLTITGNYTQAAGGVLSIQVRGLAIASGYGQLIVQGTATLDGTLRIDLAAGYTPVQGDQLIPVIYSSRTGNVAISSPSLPPSLYLDATYEPSQLRLSVTGAQPPTAPSGVTATAASQSQINLTWTDNSSDETGFKIERATDSGFAQNLTLVTTTAANVSSYSDTGLAANTAYYYRVRATNAGVDSGNSNTAGPVMPLLQVSGDQGAAGQADQIRLARNSGNPALLDVFFNGATPTYSVNFAVLNTIVINGLGGDDTLTLDLANGPVIPAGGISYDGGAQTSGDSLIIAGSSGYDGVTFADGQVSIGSGIVTLTGVESRSFKGGAGNDSLTLGAGSYAFASDLGVDTPHLSLTLADGAQVVFSGVQHLGGLSLSGSAKVTLAEGGRSTLVVQSLSFGGSSSLDVADNAVIVDYTGGSPFAAVYSLVASSAASRWAGNGIVSHTAASGGSQYAIGVADNSVANLASFAGQTVDGTSVLIRFTYSGDANLDGQVDLTDLSILAGSWQMAGRQWGQGDVDYSGLVDLTDLVLLASNWQKVLPKPAAAEVVSLTSDVAGVSQPVDAAPAAAVAGEAVTVDPTPAEAASPQAASAAATVTSSAVIDASATTVVQPAESARVAQPAVAAPVVMAKVRKHPRWAVVAGGHTDGVLAVPAVSRRAGVFSDRPLAVASGLVMWPITCQGTRTLLGSERLGVRDSRDILLVRDVYSGRAWRPLAGAARR